MELKERIEWQREDMRKFVRADCYDLVIQMYSSFGYFADPADDLLVLKNIYTSLKSGGISFAPAAVLFFLIFRSVISRDNREGHVLLSRKG